MAMPRPTTPDRIPPLTAGDRLAIEEFEWLAAAHPEIKKAELIDGMVFLEMSVGPAHADIHKAVMTLLGVYESRNPTVQGLDNATVRLGSDEVQPDAVLRLRDGGSSVRTERRIEGPPELVIEVAATSFTYDSHLKKRIYERAGVAEYLLLEIYERNVEWWFLRDGKYGSVESDRDWVFESRVFPGLRLDSDALWAGDMAKLLGALNA